MTSQIILTRLHRPPPPWGEGLCRPPVLRLPLRDWFPRRRLSVRAWVRSGVAPLVLGLSVAGSGCVLGGLLGCNDLTGSPGLPAGVENPEIFNNATGALGMRNAAISQVEAALEPYVVESGLLTDELEDVETGASAGVQFKNGGAVQDPLDERILPEGTSGGDNDYAGLQYIRTTALQALGALATYDTAAAGRDSARVLRGELYALEGYAEILLADLFCSGVPLSTLDYQQDFTYAPSSSTTQVYLAAIATLDTARTLAAASDSVENLARVLMGRAYLALGNYPVAADDVATVPAQFVYQMTIPVVNPGASSSSLSKWNGGNVTVSDVEGINGLPYLSSGDPRTTVVTTAAPNPSNGGPFIPITFPTKYKVALTNGSGSAPFTLASGIEARLIQAEAAWHGVATGAGSWLAQLNALRETAITPALPDTTDPETPTAQIALLFRERAFWLFLDGHRQGDLRRLLRQYPIFKSQANVYPTGPYLAPGTGVYGSDVTVPIPTTEYANPNYHGCLSRAP
jgi:hypothetical protein